jgi:hypothetical protein
MKHTHTQGIDRHGIHQLTTLEWLELTGWWECYEMPEHEQRGLWLGCASPEEYAEMEAER